jgi:hypothetical protein
MRLLLVVLAVALSAPGCGLINAAGDPGGDSNGDDDDADAGVLGNGPHVVTFTPSILVTDACGLADELDVAELTAEIDAAGRIAFDIDDATGTFIAAVFEGQLDSDGGAGDLDCDPGDPDPPFVTWTVSGNPEDGFAGPYEHFLDGEGMLTIVRQ